MNRLAPVLLIVIAAAGHATELCVVEPAIGFEDGKWTYMTGVGPDGAVPRPMRPENGAVAKVLEQAAKTMNAGVQVCMTGAFKDQIFEVSNARLNVLHPEKSREQEQTRCGWVENPTPGNWSLVDKDGEWTIAVQGDYRAAGADDLPDFGKRWVVTNAGSHGYGCGCMTVKVDAKEKTVLSVRKVKVQAISKCRNDKDLPKHGKE